MTSSTQVRRRPLRTYGRQAVPLGATASDTPENPPAKRRRVGEVSDSSLRESDPSKGPEATSRERTVTTAAVHTQKQQTQQQTLSLEKRPSLPAAQAPSLPSASTTRKATITSYFRVVPHLKSDSSSCSEDVTSSTPPAVVVATSSPSSPPTIGRQLEESRAKRKPRRLTTKTKPRTYAANASDDEEEDGRDDDGNQMSTRRGKKGAVLPAAQVDASVMAATSLSSLNSASADMANMMNAAAKSSTAHPQRRKQRPEAMIQQTLSLSMSEKGFTECAECSMLYNPLHEKDRRLHARQHAVVMKAREQQKENDGDE
ncbi:hypothetical protein Micbo1qcDRAFT_74596 [Microdochium bolleyi]|uniref:N-acetyltransferase ESCO zinc-finger domain-containing protein n=1 Tax=Microdochium bolleyi TaxID=196109 RepID=A0A136IZA9_9PEZI|nr:hypothetical protein Micbo1qcDRAFT_74596 [Microdochium bolleyi]